MGSRLTSLLLDRLIAKKRGRTRAFFFMVKSRWPANPELSLRNSADRALRFTCTAVDAGISVDDILCIALSNSLYGALSSTGSAADASIVNNTCHDKFLLLPINMIIYSSVLNRHKAQVISCAPKVSYNQKRMFANTNILLSS